MKYLGSSVRESDRMIYRNQDSKRQEGIGICRVWRKFMILWW